MNDVFIVGAKRSAIGRAGRGSLKDTRPDDLAALILTAAIRQSGINPELVEDVILGCAQPELEQGMDIARIAVLRAKLPSSIPGMTVNRFCASGLEAIAIAANRIACGQAQIIAAGGVESMSRTSFMGETMRQNPILTSDGSQTYIGMGPAVEQLAARYEISRSESDEFSVGSHTKALHAISTGKFASEIEHLSVDVITDNDGKLERSSVLFDTDEGPRAGTSLDGLSKLKPAFGENGIITAGSASQRSDGAACVVLASADAVQKHQLTPLLRFAGYATAATTPPDFGLGPALAIPKLMKQAGLSPDDLDVIELNEAFAAQVLCCLKAYPLPMDRINPNGGAIALGHPLGCTGARQVVSLAGELSRRKGKYGLVSMCAALGMGAAGLFGAV